MAGRPMVCIWLLVLAFLALSMKGRSDTAVVCATGAVVIAALAPTRKKGP